MANMFEQANSNLVAGKKKTETAKEPVVEPKKPEAEKPKKEKNASAERKTQLKEGMVSVDDILAGLEKTRKAKAHCFYLDDEVMEALDKLAKKNNTNISKTLNTILKAVLIKD